jgi:hypothetical protein
MAFDNLLEDVCNDATVFFAMIQMCIYILINPLIFEIYIKITN